MDFLYTFKKTSNRRKKEFKSSCCDMEKDFTVLSSGECTFCLSDYDGEIKLGNLNDNSFEEIFFGRRASVFKSLNQKGHLFSDICLKCKKIKNPS